MKTNVRFWFISLIAVMMMALAACGAQPATAPQAPPPASSGDTSSGDSEASGASFDIGIKGEELAFDQDAISVSAAEGETITVNFENTSQTQEHNFVLFKHNDMDTATTFNDAAMAAVDTSYYPEDDDTLTADVLVHVATLQPGESGSATFESPGAGEYLYICTVPGHLAAGDYGVLTIE